MDVSIGPTEGHTHLPKPGPLPPDRPRLRDRLAFRVLALALLFVVLAEILIFAPAIGSFRLSWLNERLSAAHLAALTIQAAPDAMVTEQLEGELLNHVGVRFIDVDDMTPRAGSNQRSYVLGSSRGLDVEEFFNLDHVSTLGLIRDALYVYFARQDRIISVSGPSPKSADVHVRIVLDEMPLCDALVDYGLRILAVSVLISAITAALMLVALNWLMVRPLRQMSDSLIAFGRNPDNPDAALRPPSRRDEVGITMRQLSVMQQALRSSLKQREHLATLGTAVTKVSHDLRNLLATASIVGEGLKQVEEPTVRKLANRLFTTIGRAITLCEQTLAYSRTGAMRLDITRFALRPLLMEIDSERVAAANGETATELMIEVPAGLRLVADRDQLHRVFLNLIRNAQEAGARRVDIFARSDAGLDHVTIRDNGPGLPEQTRRELFQPFAHSGRSGGSGLGLAIAREIALAHQGELSLVETGPEGTIFELILPGLD